LDFYFYFPIRLGGGSIVAVLLALTKAVDLCVEMSADCDGAGLRYVPVVASALRGKYWSVFLLCRISCETTSGSIKIPDQLLKVCAP
jgi:hypothetical protein